MSEYTAVLDEKIWEAWLLKSKLREQRTASRMKTSAAALLGLAALGGAVYLLGLFQRLGEK
ncbi:MAG: hypothetical protein RL328_2742 [Acidobacteriota bacterium]|jgi:hypothetical protein